MLGGIVFRPDGLGADLGDQCRMRFDFLDHSCAARSWPRPLPGNGNDPIVRSIAWPPRLSPAEQTERRLPAADHLDIDFGEKLGVEQRAVFGAVRIVDAVAAAERIERVRAHRVLAAGKRQRVRHQVVGDRRQGRAGQIRR